MNGRTLVKICGLRNVKIVDQIVNGTIHPDYIGFVFAPSRRQITIPQGQEFATRLFATEIRKVGVFVDAPYQELVTAAKQCQLDVLQLHGNESPELCKELKKELQISSISIWKCCSIGENPETANGYTTIRNYKNTIDSILLDTYVPNLAGGTGRSFNWSRINQVRQYTEDAGMDTKLVVAGGIREQNVVSLIHKYHPDCLDVSSGIESDDGSQDYDKIKSLLEKVRMV